MIIATSDEIHQMYSANRSPAIKDVGIDTAGVVTGVILSVMCCTIIQHIHKKILRKEE